MKFYDLKHRKSVEVPESKISQVVKKTKNGRSVTMALGKLDDGRTLYKIIANKKT
jgi:hypothetical protein